MESTSTGLSIEWNPADSLSCSNAGENFRQHCSEPTSSEIENEPFQNSPSEEDSDTRELLASLPSTSSNIQPFEPRVSDSSNILEKEEVDVAIEISTEDLVEAGLEGENLDNLSTEQISLLMAVAEKRRNPNYMEEVAIDEQFVAHSNNIDVPPEGDAIRFTITTDGGVKIEDVQNQEFMFTSEQLQAMNIDINNLSEENLQSLIHTAMPLISIHRNDMGASSGHEYHSNLIVCEPGPSTSKQQQENIAASGLLGIGSQVEVHHGDKSQWATVRYVRSNGGYKVQYADGHFEWVTEDQLTFRSRKDTFFTSARIIHSSGIPRLLKRPASSSIGPIQIKRSYEANFCCPICARKVYQKEPSYIVVRIPACDSCTKEKVVVFDD